MILKKKHFLICFFGLTGLLLFFAPGCDKEDPAEMATLGSVTITDITPNTAVISGSIVHDGGVAVSEKGVVWGTSENPTVESNDGKTSVGSGDGDYTVNLTGLSPATKYYVRGYATNSEGTSYSSQVSFTTEGLVGEVATAGVTDITHESAVSGGEVTDDGGLEVAARGVVWSTSEDPDIDDNEGITEDGDGLGEFTSELEGLSAGTTYYVRAYATNSEGTAYGSQEEFVTEGELPTVTTSDVTDITHESAVSGGDVTDDGGLEVTARGVVWSTSENPDVEDNEGITEDGDGLGEFTSELEGLSAGTTYYVRAYATNSEGTAYGSQEEFVTEGELPTVTTSDVTDITHESAVSGGDVTDDGGVKVTDKGVVWSTSQGPTTENNDGKTNDGDGTGSFTSDLESLSRNTTYYVRAYATNSEGTAYGDEKEFTTKSEVPTVTTADVTDITTNSAKSGGDVTYDGGTEVTDKGVVWDTSENPTTDDNEGKTDDGDGTGTFTSDIENLSPNTTYYVRAYATNSEGTAYGNQEEFVTEGELPTVTTADVTDITHESAVSGGDVTDDGGLEVTARGVVWGLFDSPTLEKNEGMTDEGSGAGEFSSSIEGLVEETTYYVRAYATNSEGTSYGDAKSFETEREPVYDIEGNEYTTVEIGAQEWMVENLRTTRLNDGTEITEIEDGGQWAGYENSVYSWYDNYGEKFKDVYGALYNFYTVATGKLCPEGWRVPTEDDWDELINYLGGDEVAGGKLKSTTGYWTKPNEGATNESGFTALPGGSRIAEAFDEYSDGEFILLAEWAFFWSYHYIQEEEGGLNYVLRYDEAKIIKGQGAKIGTGQSVRCIKGEQGDLPGDPPKYIMP